MMDNIFNIEVLNHVINFTGENVASNAFVFGGWLMDGITCNSNFIVLVGGPFIIKDDNIFNL